MGSSNMLPALADALKPVMDAKTERPPVARLRRQAALAVAVVAGILAGWSLLAPLSGAVIAPGFIKTELNRKTVQHQEGGIVRQILVREGQRVKAGEPLVVVGDMRTDSLLELYQNQYLVESIRQARLTAEFELADGFALPSVVKSGPAADAYLARERALFKARRKTLDEQIESLQAQIEATESQMAALGAQIASTRRAAELAREELEINRGLLQDGYVQRTRILALERGVEDYRSRASEQSSELSLARQRVGDLHLRMGQARNQYRQQAATELKDTTTRLREIEEQLRPARDLADRQFVRSPVDGEVMSIRVAAVGAVIGPREPILEVVPEREQLVVEARVQVSDIEHVRVDGPAEVRLTAYEYRSMPMLKARVQAVSADRMEDSRTGAAWYSVLVDVEAGELAAYPDARMQAGMPAEVYVTTPARTLFDYVVRPVMISATRGMREP